jgi:succinate dehydrogenase / fumarate reductase cytochrome b subunit
MALTGLFLVSFLLVHMSGNTLLFQEDPAPFNEYSRFMTTNPLIRVMEIVLFAGFIFHILDAANLTIKNRKARTERYAIKKDAGNSSWFSRNMGLTGSVVFIFLAVHLVGFWGVFHFGEGQSVSVQQASDEMWKLTAPIGTGMGDLALGEGDYLDASTADLLQKANVTQIQAISMYEVVKSAFSQWWIVLFYILAMGLLAFHLNHGFQSAFRTLGLYHSKYWPIVTGAGLVFSILVPLVFAAMPVYQFIISQA